VLKQRREVHLAVRVRLPELRVRLIDEASIGDDPLSIERAERVAHRRDARPAVLGDRNRARRVPGEALLDHLLAVLVAELPLVVDKTVLP
jgi:hypothetical protein